MSSTISSRPNHYEALGLTPAASDDEIARAFARKMNAFRWHPAGAAAQLWIAYETLRDRIKRADYDRSLGLVPKRQRSWSMAVNQQQWTSFIAADVRENEPARAAEPHVRAAEASEAPIDARLEAIAASIRELTKPADPLHAAAPPLRQPVQPRRQPAGDLDIVIDDIRRVGREERERLQQEDRSLNWKRPLQLAGGLVVGAGILGVVLGISARDSAAPADAQTPAPRTHIEAAPNANAVAPVEPLAPFTAGPKEVGLYSAKARPYRRPVATPRSAQIDSMQTSDGALLQSQPDAAAGDQLAADPASADPLAPKPADATLPLPKSTIARTIDRIGYRCGDVASTTVVDGTPGAFSVTCSSGQSYRATPVHGRYRFRRSKGG